MGRADLGCRVKTKTGLGRHPEPVEMQQKRAGRWDSKKDGLPTKNSMRWQEY